jgi:tetratricopeptide (TPR) repeat protein
MNYQEEGNQALKRGALDEALDFYTKGIEKSPNNFQLYSNRSLVFLKKQKFKNSLDDAVKTIELAPDWVKVGFKN